MRLPTALIITAICTIVAGVGGFIAGFYTITMSVPADAPIHQAFGYFLLILAVFISGGIVFLYYATHNDERKKNEPGSMVR